MISIEKLMQNLEQCRDTNITLPNMNDSSESIFIQKTAIDIRREELESLDTVITQLNEANYTMDKELEEVSASNSLSIAMSISDGNSNGDGRGKNKFVTPENAVPSKSLIIYTENETAPLPEIILNLFNLASVDSANWYIYGVKNPESLYKSFLLLTKMDFIIKNKNEKKNEVATFKREMAMQYETFYKSLNYRKLRFPHYEMVHNLTSVDNYAEYDAIKYMVDYSMCNLIILDIVGEKYLDIKYTPHSLGNSNGNGNGNNSSANGYGIIIKYSNNTYLPLMNSSGTHLFNSSILNIISRHFERIVLDKFKETLPVENATTNANTNANTNLNNNNEDYIDIPNLDNTLNINNLESIDDETLDLKEGGDILNCETISVFYNNTISSKIDNSKNYEPIIKTGSMSFAIEDMIDIEEQEDTPIGEMPITKTNSKNVEISIPKDNQIVVNKVGEEVAEQVANVPQDAFAELMNKIPMKGKAKKISPKSAKVVEKTTLESLLNTVKTNTTVLGNTIGNNIGNEKSDKSDIDELQPIGKYNLVELQMLARFHKIDTQKEGSSGKKINKTKGEMYEEIQEKQNRKK